MPVRRAVLVAVTTLLLTAAPAHALTIGFEAPTVNDGDVVTNQYASFGVQFGTAASFGGPSLGGADTFARVPDVVAGAAAHAGSQYANVPVANNGDSSSAVTALRVSPSASSVQMFVGSGSDVRLTAFSGSGTQVGDTTVTPSTTSATTSATVSTASAQIVYVVIQSDPLALSPIVIDDLTAELTPTVVTQAATAITDTTAQLNAEVNPQDELVSYKFEYGTTALHGHETASNPVPEGTSAKPVALVLTGLEPETTYHYRADAISAAGLFPGNDVEFTTGATPVTPPPPPPGTPPPPPPPGTPPPPPPPGPPGDTPLPGNPPPGADPTLPRAAFAVGAQAGSGQVPTGAPVVLDASASTGTNLRYAWDLDVSGAFATEGGPTIQPAFDTAGAHPVTLKVTDALGAVASVTQTVTVVDPPSYKLSMTPAIPRAGDDVTFKIASTGSGASTRAVGDKLLRGTVFYANLGQKKRNLYSGVFLNNVEASDTGIFKTHVKRAGTFPISFDIAGAKGDDVHLVTTLPVSAADTPLSVARRFLRNRAAFWWSGVPGTCKQRDSFARRCESTVFEDVSWHEKIITVTNPLQEQIAILAFGGKTAALNAPRPGGGARAHAASQATYDETIVDDDVWRFESPCPSPYDQQRTPGQTVERLFECPGHYKLKLTIERHAIKPRNGSTPASKGEQTGTDEAEAEFDVVDPHCGALNVRGYQVVPVTSNPGDTDVSVGCFMPNSGPGGTNWRTVTGFGLVIGALHLTPGDGPIAVDESTGFVGPASLVKGESHELRTNTANSLRGTFLGQDGSSLPLGPMDYDVRRGFELSEGSTTLGRGAFACKGKLGGQQLNGCAVKLTPGTASTPPMTNVDTWLTLPKPLGVSLEPAGQRDGKPARSEKSGDVLMSFSSSARPHARRRAQTRSEPSPDPCRGSSRAASRQNVLGLLGNLGLLDFDIDLPPIPVGPVQLRCLHVSHHRSVPADGTNWHAGMLLDLSSLSLGKIDAHDSQAFNPPDHSSGFGFNDDGGRFYAGASYENHPGLQLFPQPFDVLRLTRLGLNFATEPLNLQGTVRLEDTANTLISIDGCLAYVEGENSGHQVTYCQGSPPGFQGTVKDDTTDTHIRIAGTTKVSVIDFGAEGFLDYTKGKLTLHGHAKQTLPPFAGSFPHISIDVNLDGELYSLDRWGVRGSASFDGAIAKATLSAAISSKGFGACVDAELFSFISGHLGMWVLFPKNPRDINLSNFHLIDESCDNGLRNVTNVRAVRGADLLQPATAAQTLGVAAQQQVTLPEGLPHAVIEVEGVDGPPRLTVTDPKGRTLTQGDGVVSKAATDAGFWHPADGKRTYFFVDHPAAGSWKIAADQPLSSVASINGMLRPTVLATVTGKGAKRLLSYKVTAQRNQTVTFFETGPHTSKQLGSTRGGTGTIRFTPADGVAGKRRITALIELDGTQREGARTVATYLAPKPVPLAAPKRLRSQLKRGALVVRWGKVKGATGYQVSIVLKSGTRIEQRLAASAASVAVPNIGPRDTGTATVTTLTDRVAGGLTTKIRLVKPPKPKPPRL